MINNHTNFSLSTSTTMVSINMPVVVGRCQLSSLSAGSLNQWTDVQVPSRSVSAKYQTCDTALHWEVNHPTPLPSTIPTEETRGEGGRILKWRKCAPIGRCCRSFVFCIALSYFGCIILRDWLLFGHHTTIDIVNILLKSQILLTMHVKGHLRWRAPCHRDIEVGYSRFCHN